ncbi:zinc ribbon domain-containing protein [Ruminococcus sp. Marseille-P6503]|uniref:zinc ribbon domain-containing protein n=1 Tax=Ruminococcus sp. Marseille-P6503 TaxID=2364796 RepID=UPI000F531A13|nr:zinc ribbon domain-containing protein [Ruminococcus sp. Marseille-P6503]
MTAVKSSRKKLCDAGSASCVFAFIALLASGAGTALEFIGREIYRREFYKNETLFSQKWDEYFVTYQHSVVLLVLSLTVLLVCLVSRRKKKIGAEFGALITVASAAVSVAPALFIYRLFNDSAWRLAAEGSDEARFMYIMQALVYGLPLLAGIFLFICGITLWGRNATDEFSVSCPCMKYMASPESRDTEEQAVEKNGRPEEIKPSFEFTNSNYMSPADGGVNVKSAPVIKETSRCKGCGAELKDGAKFCQRCGEKIGE